MPYKPKWWKKSRNVYNFGKIHNEVLKIENYPAFLRAVRKYEKKNNVLFDVVPTAHGIIIRRVKEKIKPIPYGLRRIKSR